MSRFGHTHGVSHPSGRCEATDRPLEPGSPAMAALCERCVEDGGEDEGFDRVDYSVEAWEEGVRPPRLFSYWRYIVPEADRKPGIVIDDTVLVDLFERLEGDERPRRIAFRYILALALMRKRKLKLVGRETTEDGETWLLQFRGVDGDAMRVANPGIGEDEIVELADQLGEILQGEI